MRRTSFIVFRASVGFGRVMIVGCMLAVATGCQFIQPFKKVEQPPARTRALLAAAEAHQISLFGDLPGVRESSYFTRTVISLRQHTNTDVGADFDADIDRAGGRMVFASTRHTQAPNLYLKTIDGVAVTQLTSDPAADVQPVFSPDGRHVAFASSRAGSWDIWMMAVDGGPPVQVTRDPGDEVHPSWSPDGRQLVYCRLPVEGGQWELWTVDVTAGGSNRFIGYGLFPRWSPRGDVIVYQRARERGSRWFGIWALTLVDGEPRFPTELASSAHEALILPAWSPDGLQLAYASTSLHQATPVEGVSRPAGPRTGSEQGVFDIWVMNADGAGKVRLTDGHTLNYAPVFGPDGRIFFTSNRSGHENIWSLMPPSMDLGPSTGRAMTVRPAATDRPLLTGDGRGDGQLGL